MLPRPPRPTLFPYTTLFRSTRQVRPECHAPEGGRVAHRALRAGHARTVGERARDHHLERQPGPERSEEHTSELQSLRHLVCRLLLEKKKKKKNKKENTEYSI